MEAACGRPEVTLAEVIAKQITIETKLNDHIETRNKDKAYLEGRIAGAYTRLWVAR